MSAPAGAGGAGGASEGGASDAGYVLVYLGVELPTHASHWHGPPFAPGSRFPLVPGKRTVIGRGADADIRCFSNAVARIHVIAELRGDTLCFEDARSTNGTWKGGVALASGTLRVGERIALAGAFVFELQRA